MSPGCEHCYAEAQAKRYGHDVWGPGSTTSRRFFGDGHWNEPVKWDRAAAAARERRRVFCGSMMDVFETGERLDPWRGRLWSLIRATPHLDWLLLTKRPENAREMLPWKDGEAPWPNVWIGCTVENQDYADRRIPKLLQVPAVVRFVSYEPALGPVNFRCIPANIPGGVADMMDVLHGMQWYDQDEPWEHGADLSDEELYPKGPRIDWIIVGGESGLGARPFDVAWAESTVDQCRRAGVPVFVKQLGAVPMENEASWRADGLVRLFTPRNRFKVPDGFVPLAFDHPKAGDMTEWPKALRVREFPIPSPHS